MTMRLVLGCGALGHATVDALADRPEELLVVAGDEIRVEALRGRNVRARLGDPTDPDALRRLVAEAGDGPPATVVVAGSDPGTNARAARAAREVFPAASILAYLDRSWDERPGEPDGARQALEGVVDRVIDPAGVVADRVLDTAGSAGLRIRKLQAILRGLDSLAVVTHDNPDPDAIASAIALVALARRAGCAAEACYAGEIAHQENRALVNLLEFDLRRIESDPAGAIEEFDGVALVDHSRPGVNDSLPPETEVDVVIDHHPPREPVEARFVDLRSDVGATSTLLVDYLRTLGIDPDRPVATGLLYGIRVDTREFRREVSPEDFDAAAYLAPWVDRATLERVESPSMSADTLETIGRAVRNREVRGSVLTSCVGTIRDRDTLAQAADRLLEMQGITTTLVYGIREGTIYISARSRGSDLDAGETLREAFGQIGDAGGHADMAGAQIPLGVLGDLDVEEGESALSSVVRDVVTDRFFETVRPRPGPESGDRYGSPDGADGRFEFGSESDSDTDPEVALPDEE